MVEIAELHKKKIKYYKNQVKIGEFPFMSFTSLIQEKIGIPSIKAKKDLLITIIFLVLTDFFNSLFFQTGSIGAIIKFCCITYCMLSYVKVYTKFEFKIVLLYILLVVSCLHSIIVYKQNPYHLIVQTLEYFSLCSFFLFKKLNVSSQSILKSLKFLMILMPLCYIFQWLMYPTPFFAAALDEECINDIEFRMRFACTMLSYLAFFFGINYFIIKNKIHYLFYTILGFIPIIIMGFRSLIAINITLLLIMTFILVVKKKRFLRTAIIFTLLLGAGFQTPLVQTKVAEMIERNNNAETFSNKDYVRNIAFYVYSDYAISQGSLHFLFGGGKPLIFEGAGYDASNKYQNIMKQIHSQRIYWGDLGLIGLCFIIGIPAVILITFICLICAYQCKNNEHLFIRFTLLGLILGSGITTSELYRNGNFYCIALLLYYIYKYNKEQQENNLIIQQKF